MPSEEGTEATLLAPGTTLGASEASLRPRAVSSPPLADTTDYGDLVVVDPVHYADIQELARGGMGRILEARDRRLGRRVAIKEMLHQDEISLVRFEREARITARLQHPGIVHVHEAGRWPTGQPFYAMKLIRGKPLDTCIVSAKTLEARLALLANVIAVVDALAYAHSEHVVHRDLKPANVLVGDFGETVVIDWGLAKDLTSDEADDVAVGPYRKPAEATGETLEGAIIGTPAYMPPEQAAGERVDARADVYALGALLYQLCVGAPPYEGRTTADVLNKVLDAPPTPIAEREPDAPIELVAIVDKAMARDPAGRFPTAKEMVVELKRFQMGQLVKSHRYTRVELVARWVRRHRAAVAVAAVAVLTLATIVALSIWKIGGEKGRADDEAAIVRERADAGTLARARDALDTDPSTALAFLKQLNPGSKHWQGARMIASDAMQRGVAHVFSNGSAIFLLAFSPDGSLLASHDENGIVKIWDLRTSSSRFLLPVVKLFTIGFDTEGRLVGLDWIGNVWRWDVSTGTSTVVRKLPEDLRDATISRDGHRIITFDRIAPATLYDLAGGERTLKKYDSAAWTPDNKSVVLFDRGNSGRVDRMDLATGAITTVRDDVQPVRITADSTHVWGGYYDGRLEDLVTKKVVKHSQPIELLVALANGEVASATSPRLRAAHSLRGEDHGFILTLDPARLNVDDYDVSIDGGTASVALRGHSATIHALTVSPEGRIASGDHDGTIRVWERPTPVTRNPTDNTHTTSFAMLSRDRSELVMTRRGPVLDVRELATGRSRQMEVTDYPAGYVARQVEWSMHMSRVGARRMGERTENAGDAVIELARSANGRRIVTLDDAGQVIVWDLDTNRGRMLIVHTDTHEPAIHVAISPDGRRVATSRDTRPPAIEQWDVSTGAGTLVGDGDASAIAYSVDGSLAVAILSEGVAMLGRDGKGRLIASDDFTYHALAFSPDGRTLVGGGDDSRVHVWDLATGTTKVWSGHTGTIHAVMFSPDGQTFATASADHSVRLWRVADGTSTIFTGHRDLVTSMVFDDNDTLVTSSLDGTARICDLRSGDPAHVTSAGLSRPLVGHQAGVVFAGHLAGDHRLLLVDYLLGTTEYLDNLPYDELSLRVWLASATNLTK